MPVTTGLCLISVCETDKVIQRLMEHLSWLPVPFGFDDRFIMIITRTQQSFDIDIKKKRETMPYSMPVFQLIIAFLFCKIMQ